MSDQEEKQPPRSILQILIAVQEAEPDITDEELRLCLHSVDSMQHFLRQYLIDLIEAIKEGKPQGILKLRAGMAMAAVERLFSARKKTPLEWLGPHNVPGSPEQRASLAWAKDVFKRATGETLD